MGPNQATDSGWGRARSKSKKTKKRSPRSGFVTASPLTLSHTEALCAIMLRMATNQEMLLAAALDGDQSALQHLLLHRYERLAGVIRKRIPSALSGVVDADDVLQTTYVQVFRGLSGFKSGNSDAFFAWVRSIAEAKLTDAIRSATRKKRGGDWQRTEGAPAGASQSFVDLMTLLSDHGRTPSGSAATHEAVAAMQVALAGLPVDQREAIWLRHIECLTMEEVVLRMNRTEGAVRGLLHRGKAALKKSLGSSSQWYSKTQ